MFTRAARRQLIDAARRAELGAHGGGALGGVGGLNTAHLFACSARSASGLFASASGVAALPATRQLCSAAAWRGFAGNSGVFAALRSNHALQPRSSAPAAFTRRCSTAASAGPQAGGLFHHVLVTSPGAQRAVGAWLWGGAAWVFSLVVLGGVTRLTRSGLSMTDWKFTGERAPRTAEDWEAEFAKYRSSPEFQHLNRGMTLDEFKFIFWMEYAHRMWGRTLGIYFAVPVAYFAARGYLTRKMGMRLTMLFAAGGTQGFVGWWMVRSGLEQPRREHDIPRVSPYRLATHLSTAFAIYSGILWTALDVSRPTPALADAALTGRQLLASLAARRRFHGLAGLIGITAISGAFVAGLDAGHAYNTFPLMGGRIVPEEYWDAQFGSWWRNSFENTAAVQFHHRVLALTTASGIAAAWAATQMGPPLPRAAALAVHALGGAVVAQVTLGIATLLHNVPVWLGSAHQAGALTLFSVALTLLHALRAPAHVKQRAAAEAAALVRRSAPKAAGVPAQA